jgi:ribokinase
MSVAVVGSINLDIVANVDSIPRPGETLLARSVAEFPGGKGANQAIAAARMGADTLMVGAVGSDAAGDFLRAYLRDSGVDDSAVKVMPDQRTGQAYINVAPSGENAIVVASGANQALAPQDIDTERLSRSTVFLAQLETPVAVIERVFSSAAAASGRRLLNAAPADPAGAALFPLVDIIIVNESELARYAQLADVPTSTDALTGAARSLSYREDQIVVVTLGAEGALIVDQDHGKRVAGRAAQAVDTTGAGDCFCGALAAALSQGQELGAALETANIAASLSVERPGAASSMPTREEVEAEKGDGGN